MPPSARLRLVPKLVTSLRDGYSARALGRDAIAGLTVAVIALPLAMALGIASIPQDVAESIRARLPWLTPPAMGLITAVVAGALISALGGSRVQIGGPTAAFIPIVFSIAAKHGLEGLWVATAMAGVIVTIMGLCGFGALVKFIPFPVTTGFTAGIAVTILASQLKDLLGISVLTPEGRAATIPAEFVPKLELLFSHLGSISPHGAAVAAGSLLALVAVRRFAPRIPGAIVVVIASSLVVHFAGWADATSLFDGVHARPLVETIGTRFGGIPDFLPAPHVPAFTWSHLRELVLPATTIAILCSIESLLSAVVADGMTGFRHRSDQELVGQGFANVASALFFGLPATGAIARTAANVKSGGRTPVAGLFHALFVLGFMVTGAPLARAIPLPALAAILVMVAWNIAEIEHVRALLKAPRADVVVLVTTFALTVFTDLTIGVGVGMVLASFLFMRQMAASSRIAGLRTEVENRDGDEPVVDPTDPTDVGAESIPAGVEVFEVTGPLFFGVAERLKDVLQQIEKPPRIFVLRMRYVPHIDGSGQQALRDFVDRCHRQKTTLLLAGVHAGMMVDLVRSGILARLGADHAFPSLELALARARELLAEAAR